MRRILGIVLAVLACTSLAKSDLRDYLTNTINNDDINDGNGDLTMVNPEADSKLNIALEKLYSNPQMVGTSATKINVKLPCADFSDCVPKSQCKNAFNNDDISIYQYQSSSVCPYSEVCCHKDNKISPCGFFSECVDKSQCLKGNKHGENMIMLRSHVVCPNQQVCCHQEDKLEAKGCGFRNRKGVDLNTAGISSKESKFGEFPWMVAILKTIPNEQERDFIGGGSIIAPNVVLTLAHKVYDKPMEELVVRAGEWDTKSEYEIIPHQERGLKQIIIHRNFTKASSINNIALIILKEQFILQPNIRSICLPSAQEVFDHSHCVVAGWGAQAFRSKEATNRLKTAEVTVVPPVECQNQLRTTILTQHFELHRSLICAVPDKAEDSYLGDGGSALACPIPGSPNRYYLAGMVAWVLAGAENNIPGAYVNMPYMRSWIDQNLETIIPPINASFFSI